MERGESERCRVRSSRSSFPSPSVIATIQDKYVQKLHFLEEEHPGGRLHGGRELTRCVRCVLIKRVDYTTTATDSEKEAFGVPPDRAGLGICIECSVPVGLSRPIRRLVIHHTSVRSK
jgi:hypothetical protein